MTSLDKLSPGELLKYHKYRKKLRHMYVCTKCAHAFDRRTPVTKCIFCSGAVKEVQRDDLPAAKQLYRYICTACDKTFVAEHAEKCIKCGSKFLHFYEASKLGTREILSMRKKQIKERLKTIGKRKKK